MRLISQIYLLTIKTKRRINMLLLRNLFKKYGKNFIFYPDSYFSYETIEIGDDVYIGPRANFVGIKGIKIGNKVMFGPDVSIIGGDHNTTQLGKFMYDVHDKLPENDLPVVIEDDVWVGACAIILKGVTLGTGSIVAAGSLVLKDIPPYSVVAGVPANVIKMRFNDSDLAKHIELLKLSK